MAKLINSIEDLRKYTTVSAAFDFNKVLAYRNRAERKFIEKLIGFTQYTNIVDHNLDENSNSPMNRVKLLLSEAAANFSLLLALPSIQVNITNAGLKETTSTKSENSDWRAIRDLKRETLKTANEALDDALEIMEVNSEVFTDWASSDLYTVFKNQLVRHTNDFNTEWDIQNNRKTFLALTPHMREVEEQYLLPMLGKCTLDFIKTNSINENVLRVQELARKAIVSFTVAKVALTGTFMLTSSSLVVVNEELPWEKSSLELSEEKLKLLQVYRQNAGEQYLKKIKTILLEFPETFTCYEDKVSQTLSNKIIKKKSHLML